MVYLTALPPGFPSREQARLEHRCGWALLRLGLVRQGFCGPEVTVDDICRRALRGPKGKPFFPEADRQFSISHSRGLAGCALERVPIGLDLERVRKFSAGMQDKICAVSERILISSEARDVLLTQLWTCKESHMKLTGRGFSQGLRETAFRTLGDEPQLAGKREAYFHSALLEHHGQSFWLTLCSSEPIAFQTYWVDFQSLDLL